jgi:hypothetical protein
MGSEGSEQSRDGGRDSAGRNGNAGRGSNAGQSSNTGRSSSGTPSDPLADFQRWLMKAGARSLGRDVADRVRSTVTGGRRSSAEVWETATTEPPPDEAPECAWCPICRAARRYREGSAGQGATGPGAGIGSSLAGVSDTLAGLAQDAFGIFEQALRGTQQRPPARPSGGSASSPATGTAPAASDSPRTASPASASPGNATGSATTGTGWPDPPAADSAPSEDAAPDGAASESAAPDSAASDSAGSDDSPVVGSPVAGRAAVHPQDEHGEPADEGGDRDEGGEAGDGPPASGGDDQVERPAE